MFEVRDILYQAALEKHDCICLCELHTINLWPVKMGKVPPVSYTVMVLLVRHADVTLPSRLASHLHVNYSSLTIS